MRGWLREYVETLRRHDGTSGSSSHHTQSTRPVPMDVDQTRAVSGFSSGKDGKGKSKGKGQRARMAKAKAKARMVTRARIRSRYPNLSNSKDTEGFATHGDISVPTAGNATPTPSRRVVRQEPDNDGDVAAVMEVDDVVMRAGEDETSTVSLSQVCVLSWDPQVLSSWTAEVANTCALRCLRT